MPARRLRGANSWAWRSQHAVQTVELLGCALVRGLVKASDSLLWQYLEAGEVQANLAVGILADLAVGRLLVLWGVVAASLRITARSTFRTLGSHFNLSDEPFFHVSCAGPSSLVLHGLAERELVLLKYNIRHALGTSRRQEPLHHPSR